MKNITYINAGAGSGKTYTLSHKLTSLIKSGVNPEEVILTTFTIKAASEFKVEAKAVLYEEGLYDEAVRLDQAMIGTVHSVCQQMISKYWFVLGLSPSMGVMSEEDANFYISQSLAELPTDQELELLHRFCEYFDFKLTKDFKVLGTDYNHWQKDLNAIIGLATNYEIDSFDESCEESLRFIRQFVKKGKNTTISDAEYKQLFDEAREHVKTAKRMTKREENLKAINEVERTCGDTSLRWYADLLSAIPATYGPTCAMIHERLSYLWNSEELYIKQKEYIQFLFELAKRWKEKFAQFKREKNLLDFNDMEKYMYVLMQHKEVAAEISRSYKYLFVDEFQDSSRIQVKIFDALSDLMEHSYWVGDYKQAIYGFRGSDTSLTKAVADLVADLSDQSEVQTLETSYRSLPDIVEVNNRVFEQTFAGTLQKKNIVLNKKRENEEQLDSLRYIRTDKNCTVAHHVGKLLAEGVTPSDIGVIARSNAELDKLASQLNDMHIPVSREDLHITDSSSYMLVASLLRIINSNDPLAKATVAILTVQDFSTKKLIEERLQNLSDELQGEDEFLSTLPLLSQLSKIKSRLQQQSVAAMIESMCIELNLYHLVGALENSPMVGVSILETLIRSGKAYENHCVQMNFPATIEGFISYVETMNPKGQGDSKGVQLHTYHSSKGLQWKYVILMSLQKVVLNESALIPDQLFGVHSVLAAKPSVSNPYPEVKIRLVPWIFGAKKNVPSTIDAIVRETTDFSAGIQDYLSEENRVLYVGMTRPRDVLILDLEAAKNTCLSWFKTVGLTTVVDSQPNGPCDLLGVGMTFSDYTLTEDDELESENELDNNFSQYQLKIAPPTFDRLPARNLSPSMEKGKAVVLKHYNFGSRITLGKQPEDMAVVGDCIHQIFAAIEEIRPAYSIDMKELIVSYKLADVLITTDDIDKAWVNLYQFMKETYGTPSKTYHERPFVFDKDGHRYTGSIDLVWQTPEGDVLIDYKTCPMGEKAVLDSQSEHYVGLYGGQLGVYASALEAAGEKVIARYIYYPVSGLLMQLG